jgi:hypothetical protein
MIERLLTSQIHQWPRIIKRIVMERLIENRGRLGHRRRNRRIVNQGQWGRRWRKRLEPLVVPMVGLWAAEASEVILRLEVIVSDAETGPWPV